MPEPMEAGLWGLIAAAALPLGALVAMLLPVPRKVVALVLADALLEKTGGDSLPEVRRNLDAYLASLRAGVLRGTDPEAL